MSDRLPADIRVALLLLAEDIPHPVMDARRRMAPNPDVPCALTPRHARRMKRRT